MRLAPETAPSRERWSVPSGPVAVITHPNPDLDAPYFREVLAGLRQGLGDWVLEINPTEGASAAGFVFLAPDPSDVRLREVIRREIPALVVNGSAEGLASIDVDNRLAAQRVVEHLLACGRRRVALINGRMEMPNARERQAGYRAALERDGLPWRDEWVQEGGFSREGGRAAMENWLRQSSGPDAVFAANDHMALGAWDVLREAGRRVPRDVALAGFDDIPEAAKAGLTTFRQPLAAMGRWAGERLAVWLRDGRKPAPGLTKAFGELAVRESTRSGGRS